VVSDLIQGRPIWFGGDGRAEASMAQFYDWFGENKAKRIHLAVTDMRKPLRNATQEQAPQTAILFDKSHVLRHLNDALDQVRKREYARLAGKERRYIKGQKHSLLSRRENLSLKGRKARRPCSQPTSASTAPTCSWNPSVNSGTSSVRAVRDVSSRTAVPVSSGNA
jgi:transposase